jgi:predicted transcriptional regulator
LEQVQKYRVDVVELKKIMVEQNLDKIVDLSTASTVDRNTLSKVINGDVKPSTTVIEKLMSALHIPPERAGAIFFSLNLRNP